jgi:hypothetical protein
MIRFECQEPGHRTVWRFLVSLRSPELPELTLPIEDPSSRYRDCPKDLAFVHHLRPEGRLAKP